MFESLVKRGVYLEYDNGSRSGLLDTNADNLSLLLSLDTNNRPKRSGNLNTLEGIVEADEWNNNGVPFTVCTLGYLINGGHRLNVLDKLAAEVEITVMWNAPPELWSTYDTNMAERKLAHHIDRVAHSRGIGIYASQLSSTLTWLTALQHGDAGLQRGGMRGMGYNLDKQIDMYERQEQDIVKSYKFIRRFVGTDAKRKTLNIGPVTMWAAIHAFLSSDSRKAANKFFILSERGDIDNAHPSKVMISKVDSLIPDDGITNGRKDLYPVAAKYAQSAYNLFA